MARQPKELTSAQKGEVETLAAVLTAEQIADYFGIGRTTFFTLMGRDPEIAERYKKGKARAIGSIAQTLISKARAGDTTAMIFFLKTQGGWRETASLEVITQEEKDAKADSTFKNLTRMLDEMASRKASLATGRVWPDDALKEGQPLIIDGGSASEPAGDV